MGAGQLVKLTKRDPPSTSARTSRLHALFEMASDSLPCQAWDKFLRERTGTARVVGCFLILSFRSLQCRVCRHTGHLLYW